jgi:hypothetical protein
MGLGNFLMRRSDKFRGHGLRRLAVEFLEDRCLLSASPLATACSVAAAQPVLAADIAMPQTGAVATPAQAASDVSTVGLYSTSGSQFFLRNSNDSGFGNTQVTFQPAGNALIPISGDFTGDGTATIGVYDQVNGMFYLRNSNDPSQTGLVTQFQFGPTNNTLLPVVGDWNGSGKDQVGLYDQSSGTFNLREQSGSTITDVVFAYGPANNDLLPIAGRWTFGATAATVGLYDPTSSLFFLRNSNSTGVADNTFLYGPSNSGLNLKPITGDWTGSGSDVVGLYEPSSSTFLLDGSNQSGFAAATFVYGPANFAGAPVVGTWNAPTLTGISPTAGSTAGGTAVTITGAGFSGATSVNFGGTRAASFIVVSDTQITAISPAAAGTVNVTVSNAGGTSTTSTAGQFIFAAAGTPTVTSISPQSGPPAGGTVVGITGAGFTDATAVNFGSTAAGSFTVVSDSQINALSPAGTGTVDVTVTTASGTSTVSTADQFTYTSPAAPTISSISPNSGPTAGGTRVVITGSGLTGATAVRFGANAASSFIFVSDSQITAISPAGTGTVNVTVTTANGTSPVSAADQFTYTSPAAPTISSISPNSGPTVGGTTVIITDTGFTGATAVNFGSTAASFAIVSDTQIAATSPAGTGTVNVTVTNANGTSAISTADQFTFVAAGAPTVTGVNPRTGFPAGGTSVTITGSGFTGATSVQFAANPASSFTVVSDSQITATSPAGTGTVDVTVTNATGTSATSATDEFSYALPGAPTISSISPNFGLTGGGTTVIITGTGFTDATSVRFGATSVPAFAVNSSTKITATSPAGTGTVHVTVTTAGGTSTPASADQFTYVTGAPAVTGLSPNFGSTAGGTTVIITGTGFSDATAVDFGSAPAPAFAVNSSTKITATSPAGTGTVHVTVANSGGTSTPTSADQFTYTTGAPAVTGISPNSGPAGGGTTVIITGVGFADATAVDFGSAPAPAFAVNSSTKITATSPAGTRTVHVTVATSKGTSTTTTADQFTYGAAPG